MNSFDVFDTLIARRYVTSQEIWRRLGAEFGIEGFEKKRPVPDTGQRSFTEIYRSLVETGVIQADRMTPIMRREIELEAENVFPVQQNCDRVRDGDVLISDMYLPGHVILDLVRSTGLERQVTIYQSGSGKASGTVWEALKANPPELHLGDNVQSDYRVPISKGINAELFPGTAFSEIEKVLLGRNMSGLALLLREIRLRGRRHSLEKFSELAHQLNLPFLFVVSELLSRAEVGNSFVFLGRDCQLLCRLYRAYYGPCSYLPFSRKVAYTVPELAAAYLRQNTPENGVLVDISSTSRTWKYLEPYGRVRVHAVIFGDTGGAAEIPHDFTCITRNSVCGETNLILEVANCGDHGSLDQIEQLAPGVFQARYGDRELPENVVTALHAPVHSAVSLARFYRAQIRAELRSISTPELLEIFNVVVGAICAQQWVLDSLPEFRAKELQQYQNVQRWRRCA